MASGKEFLAFVCDQLALLEGITSRRMFGEYALYWQGKVVALICDDQLFIKPTAAGRAFAGDDAQGAAPFPGAKDWLRVDERLDDAHWLAELLRRSWDELPLPAPKKPRSRRAKTARKPAQPA